MKRDARHREALGRVGIDVLEDDAVRLVGRWRDLQGVELRSGAVVACELVFFSLPNRPVSDPAEQLGCVLTAKSYVVIDGDAAKSQPGFTRRATRHADSN